MNVKYRVTLDTSERVQLVGMVLGGKGDLESIHRVVMTLVVTARRYAGDYDGWECPVEAAN